MSTSKNLSNFRALGVIPARGGSKGIPKKNIADLNGSPLLYYTINSANGAKLLDYCIVSTDCSEIASVAQSYGAEVPFIRPEKLSTDEADSLSVVRHALEFAERLHDVVYHAVVMLQPTTPFRKSYWIDKSLTLLANSDFDSVVSVVNVGANHPYRMYHLGDGDELVPFVDGVDDPMMPRQHLPAVYIRSGDIYATRRSCILEKNSLIGSYSAGLVIESDYAVNIDEPIDLEVARLKMRDFKET